MIKEISDVVITNRAVVPGIGVAEPVSARPLMEGRAMTFKVCAGINAVPTGFETRLNTTRFNHHQFFMAHVPHGVPDSPCTET